MSKDKKEFRPMLAGKAPDDLSSLDYPLLASPKIDGVRAVIRHGKALSRSLKPIPSVLVQRMFGRVPLESVDGELIIMNKDYLGSLADFNRVQSVVMSQYGDLLPHEQLKFLVFDVVRPGLKFTERQLQLRERNLSLIPGVELVPQFLAATPDELLAIHHSNLKHGFEGTMVRSLNGLYKYGRSTTKEQGLLKIKPFEDAEAEVIGFVEKMHNTNPAELNEVGLAKRSSSREGLVPAGTLGALMCRTPEGVEFNIGVFNGLDDKQKQELWNKRYTLIGQHVKYKALAFGSKEAPRHPVFIGFRSPLDMETAE